MREETKIFRFLFEAPANSEIFITTWGISNRKYLEDLVCSLLRKNCKVRILVGYSKISHQNLMENIISYVDCKWQFRVLPGFHAKIWMINNDGKIKMMTGSSNFTPNTIHNLMLPTKSEEVKKFLIKYWKKGTPVSRSTNLKLIKEI